MPWKDRSNETQSVWSCLAIITLLCAVLCLYLIAGKESKEGKQTAYVTGNTTIGGRAQMRRLVLIYKRINGKESWKVAADTDTGNIRYHAKRVEEGL